MRWYVHLLVLVCASSPASVVAQFSAQRFVPSPHGRDYLTVASTEINGHLAPSAQLVANYATKPLVFSTASGEQAVIDQLLGVDALFSMSFFERFELGLGLPFYPFLGGAADASFVSNPRSASLGDLRFDGKVVLLAHGKRGFGLAVDLGLTFPTARDGAYLGEESVSFVPRLVAELDYDDYRVALNAGYRVRKNQVLGYLPVNDEILLGLGASMPLGVSGLTLLGELQSASEARYYFVYENTSYLEGDLAVRYHAPFGLQATLGAGGGLLRGMGDPQVRVFASLGYVPFERQDDTDATDHDRDRDRDGVLDSADRCPDAAEDVDQHQDADGCPDPDNDADGLLDAADRCPDRAEDRDNFADGDGCPDPDNDGDGLPDARDGCPDVAEDLDGVDDADGCPDEDNDGDGVPDSTDKCPTELETVNDFLDDDGCPDVAPTVYLTGDRIVITQKVFFQKGTATIVDKSKAVLDGVAAILIAHPEIAKVSVEGHTSSEGNATTNKQLSQWRAGTIVNYLVKKKVDRKRLKAVGWGSEKPLTALPEKSDDERETNRRVDFLIVP